MADKFNTVAQDATELIGPSGPSPPAEKDQEVAKRPAGSETSATQQPQSKKHRGDKQEINEESKAVLRHTTQKN